MRTIAAEKFAADGESVGVVLERTGRSAFAAACSTNRASSSSEFDCQGDKVRIRRADLPVFVK